MVVLDRRVVVVVIVVGGRFDSGGRGHWVTVLEMMEVGWWC